MKQRIHRIKSVILIGILLLGSGFISLNAKYIPQSSYIEINQNQNNDFIKLSISLPSPTITLIETDEGSFSHISYLNEGFSTEIGIAKLPKIRRMIELPPNVQAVVNINSQSWDDISLIDENFPSMIIPLQPSQEKVSSFKNEISIIDHEYYSNEYYMSDETVIILETGNIRNHHFALIEISPVRYKPSTGDLQVLTSCEIEIIYSQSSSENTPLGKKYESETFQQLTSFLFLNSNSNSKTTIPNEKEGYLILTYDDFYQEILPFAKYKETEGYAVTIVNTSFIGDNLTSKTIQSFIKSAYNSWSIPPVYLLLVGDIEYIPTFKGEDSKSATDLYYSTIDNDLFADIITGRFPASDETHVKNMVNKTILYQSGNFQKHYVKNASFLASQDEHRISEGTHNYVIDTYLNPRNYSCDKLYTAAYKATTNQVIDAINDGRGLIIYSGHGSMAGWEDGPKFNRNDLSDLSDANLFPFVCSFSCLTGNFLIDECFGETWLVESNKGSIGFFGSSTLTMWDEDDDLERFLFSSWWDDNITTIGGMTSASLQKLYTTHGGSGNSRYYMECYNLLGDPSLHLWENNPLFADFSFNQLDDGTNLTIQFTDMSRGCISNRIWDFGDGNTTSEKTPNYSFKKNRSYTVTLNIFNKDNQVDTIQQDIFQIEISEPLPGFYLFGNKIFDSDKIISLGSLTFQIESILSENEGFDYVVFSLDDELRETVMNPPFKWEFSEKGFGTFTLKAAAYRNNNVMFDTLEFFVFHL